MSRLEDLKDRKHDLQGDRRRAVTTRSQALERARRAAEKIKALDPRIKKLKAKIKKLRDSNSDMIGAGGIELLKKWEGFLGRVIEDPLVPGLLTGGYGHTGPGLKLGQNVTRELAERWLRADTETAADAIARSVDVPLTRNQRDALICWAYNVGAGAVASSTLVAKLNNGRYDQVPDELRRWVYANGQFSQGLLNRRNAEIELWRS